MQGLMGQYVFAIPEKNTVIVRLGRKKSARRTSQHYPEDINYWLDAGLDIVEQSSSR
jgi:hypothetical protein